MKPRQVITAVLTLLTAICCAADSNLTVPLTGNDLIDGPIAISNGPPKDKVLWEFRTASAEMRVGDFDQAKQFLDDALPTVSGILGKSKSGAKARNKFYKESSKVFVGEPYERVMAYYYRGVLYWMNGDIENARACFRAGRLEDSSVEEKYTDDYVLLYYLEGLATVKLGGDGSDAFAQSTNLCLHCQPPPSYNPDANVLIFLEYGRGPIKRATGMYNEELRFGTNICSIQAAEIKVEEQSLHMTAYDDLCFQATTRGGRVMDHVLAGKAVWKTGTDVAGKAAMVGGAVTAAASRNRTGEYVGLGIFAAGLATEIASKAMKPQADIRCWSTLPHYLSFASLRLPPGQHAMTINFQDNNGQTIAELSKSITVVVPDGKKDTVVFISDQSKTGQQFAQK